MSSDNNVQDFYNEIEPITSGIEGTQWGEFWLEVIPGLDAFGNLDLIVTTDIGSDESWPVSVFETDAIEALREFWYELSRQDLTPESINEFVRGQIAARQVEAIEKYRPRSARLVADQIQARA